MNLDRFFRIVASGSYRFNGMLGTRTFPTALLLKGNPRLATASTDIVLEGFPRSGNSSTVARFAAAQCSSVKIAHHLHHPFQIKLAKRYSLPCIVMFRDPASAVISLKSFGFEWLLRSRTGAREVHASLETLLKYWQSYYVTVLRNVDTVFLVELSTSIERLNTVIEVTNLRWKTNFDLETKYFDATSRGWHATPSVFREEIKTIVTKEFDTLLSKGGEFKILFESCTEIHEALIRNSDHSLHQFTR